MARRKDHTREELTTLALTAAGEILAHDGVEAVTARAVAERIGYAAGTLYNLFHNRDELLLRLHAATLEQLEEVLRQARCAGESPEQRIETLTAAWLDFTRRHPHRWRGLFHYQLAPGMEHPSWYQTQVGRLLALVEEALAPLFPPAEKARQREAALALWGGLHGIWSLAESGRLPLLQAPPLEQLCTMLTRHFLAGLRAEINKVHCE